VTSNAQPIGKDKFYINQQSTLPQYETSAEKQKKVETNKDQMQSISNTTPTIKYEGASSRVIDQK
jgi:hypothetical protein